MEYGEIALFTKENQPSLGWNRAAVQQGTTVIVQDKKNTLPMEMATGI